MTYSNRRIAFKKAFNAFINDSKIKTCFHFDRASCSSNIIVAHSLQRNGVLNLLASEVNSNMGVYSFLHTKLDDDGHSIGFELQGNKNASTFTGFCGHHDTITFEPIENNEVDVSNDEHCFLLSYRSFAKEYHAKIEVNQGFRKNDIFNSPDMEFTQVSLLIGNELAQNDLLPIKTKLNNMLQNKNFSELEYFTYTIDSLVQIASASPITPAYYYDNKIFNLSQDPNVVYEPIIFTVLPVKSGKTHVVMACLNEHKKATRFIDQISNLNRKKLEYAISSIMIGEIENTFISPTLWDKMSKDKQKQLLLELHKTKSYINGVPKGFFHSKINFFDPQYF